MRILTVHNYYQQPGGEEQIFATESALLESRGHQVSRYTIHNDRIEGMNCLTLAKKTIWNTDVYRDIREIVRQERPEVAHFHNTFPLISPAAYHAMKDEGVPVIQTLHNYRLLCPNALFFRNGKICEDCLGKCGAIPGIIRGCYRDSHAASGVVAAMVNLHSMMCTWTKTVNVFVAYSQFALNKFVQGGLPEKKILFKTNFLHPAPAPGTGRGGYAIFVGRLSPEKGLGTLLAAWEQLGEKIPLKIVGDGPLAPQVIEATKRIPGVEWLGRRPLEEVYELMGEATMLIFPSEWYETFGRVAIEAFAKGTPVVASAIGAIAELVSPGQTGLHFRPGDAQDLAEQVKRALTHPEKMMQMRRAVRAEFEAKYTAEENYRRMMEIYTLAPQV